MTQQIILYQTFDRGENDSNILKTFHFEVQAHHPTVEDCKGNIHILPSLLKNECVDDMTMTAEDLK